MTKAELYLSVSETAKRLGVTAKTLRLYDREGLVAPRRTSADWRVYGRAELERLHLVLALKSFGLTLARIRDVMAGGTDLKTVLAAQEDVLSLAAEKTESALALVKAARAALETNGSLSLDELIALTKESTMSQYTPGPEMKRLIDRHFSTSQKESLKKRSWTEQDQIEANQRWAALFAEAEALQAKGDPASPEALDLAARWKAEVEKFTLRDPGMTASVGALYREGFSNETLAKAMPMSKEVWAFMKAAQAALAASEDDGETIV